MSLNVICLLEKKKSREKRCNITVNITYIFSLLTFLKEVIEGRYLNVYAMP